MLEVNTKKINGMWYIKMKKTSEGNTPQKHIENSVFDIRKNKYIITFYFQAIWNLVPATWIKSIKTGLFATRTGLTAELVTKRLKDSISTTKGHQKSENRISDPHVTLHQ